MIKNSIPMQYPEKYKDVDGVSCPEVFFTSYDMTCQDCIYCGRGKHYKNCSYLDKEQSCFGWGVRDIGPMSCKGYNQYREDRKEFL